MNDKTPNTNQEAGETNGSRRAFLATAGAATASLMVAPGIHLIQMAQADNAIPVRANGTAASSAVRWGMLVDTTKCAKGCTACVDACNSHNALESALPESQKPQWIRKVDLKETSTGRELSLPMMCQHCAHPPCVDVCPTGASFKRPDGIVLVDRHICIGCRYCMMACPYKARSFVHETLENQNPDVPRGKGCVESCTLCDTRIDKGQQPACVEACTAEGHNALLFGDLRDGNSEIAKRVRTVATSQVRADLKLDTGVRYQGI